VGAAAAGVVVGSAVAAVSDLAAVVALAAVAAVAAGSVVSGSVPAQAARLALAAADRGERAACAKCHEQRRCDGRRTTSGLAHEARADLACARRQAGTRRRARLYDAVRRPI
jgi:hypothetical protein